VDQVPVLTEVVALAILTARHLNNWVLGTVGKGGKGGPRAKLVGQHPRF